jgi:excisionase family DNA binding protein
MAKFHPERMSVAEVADLLGVSRQTVYDGAGRGEIPHVRLGRRILFSRKAIAAWFHGDCAELVDLAIAERIAQLEHLCRALREARP